MVVVDDAMHVQVIKRAFELASLVVGGNPMVGNNPTVSKDRGKYRGVKI